MVKEYLDIVTGRANEESSPLQVFYSQKCVWVVQACLKKAALNYSSYVCPPGLKQQLATSFVLGNACLYSLCIGHPFYLGSKKCNMKISSIIREFSYTGCPIGLSSGRQQYVHSPCAASRVSGMISVSVTHRCADSLHGIFLRESSSK